MKQHITIEDFEKLSEEKQKKVVELLRHSYNPFMMFLHNGVKHITIGKLIEILGENFMGINENMVEREDGFFVELRYHDAIFNTELCDALWESVLLIID